MNSLYEIGLKYGTDKTSHNYLPSYEELLSPFRFESLHFLEIGVAHGHSVKMWEEYFPNAIIYGADIHDKKEYETERIKTFIVNQEKVEELMTLPDNLDFILDDGGHTMLQQQVTLNTLFKHKLKPGGVFILEDLHIAIQPHNFPVQYFSQSPTNNTVKLLNDLKNKKLSDDSDFFITEKDFYELVDEIESLEILYTRGEDSVTSIIKKKK